MPGPYPPADFKREHVPLSTKFPGVSSVKNNFIEWYSWAVISSVATSIGLVCQVPVVDFIQADFLISTHGRLKGRKRTIRVQAKATTNVSIVQHNGQPCVAKSVSRDYYDNMQDDDTIPIFMVVVAVPPLDQPWLRIRQSVHAMHAAAWWGAAVDPPNGLKNQTIWIPVTQRLDADGFETMLLTA